MQPDQLTFFDPKSETTIVDRRLPHWQQPGVICFITWRTHDSMPEAVVRHWHEEREKWLIQAGLTVTQAQSRNPEVELPYDKQIAFKGYIANRWMDRLDECHGACDLRDPKIAKVVADSLHHFDEERYLLTDFVIMPNHIHILVAFPGHDTMVDQCESWKHFTAREINRMLGRSGRYWQQDAFDHLLRSEHQYRYLRDYLAKNPEMARLKSGEYLRYQRKGVS